jgi:hypothetical protein
MIDISNLVVFYIYVDIFKRWTRNINHFMNLESKNFLYKELEGVPKILNLVVFYK